MTITISRGITSVSSKIPNTIAYLVEGSGTLNLLGGGIVSGPIAVKTDSEITDPPVERWAHRVSGNWTLVSNWTPAVVPGSADNVVINLAGPYTVTSLADETVNNLVLGASVSLDIGGGSGFVAVTGVTNSGTINVEDNSTFELGGTFNNIGTIALDSTGDTTDWEIDGNVTLRGGGKVKLNDSATSIVSYGSTAAAIVGDGSTGTLTNVNNIVTGNGTIGDSNLTVSNQSLGVIDAAAKQSLTFAGAATERCSLTSITSIMPAERSGRLVLARQFLWTARRSPEAQFRQSLGAP
jgi:hypothetical protein